MSVVLEQPTEQPSRERDFTLARRARLFLWISLGFAILAFAVGASWDRGWHATHPFDQFWSPPHLFIYAMTLGGALAYARILLDHNLRQQFGPGMALPLVPFSVPPSLLFAGGGYATLWLAGALDNVWHSNFGLDETLWSFPHAMLGWGILTVLTGLLTAHLALDDRRPDHRFTRFLFGWLLLATVEMLVAGPFGNQTIPAITQKIATLPPLLIPPTQHLFRIEAAWNLNHTNPLYLVLAALGAGIGLAILRGIDSRPPVVAGVALGVTVVSAMEQHRLAQAFSLAGQPNAWLPSPVVVAAVIFLLAVRVGIKPELAWLVAGAVFGLFVALFWNIGAAWIIPGAIAMAGGAAAGQSVAGIIQKPTGPAVLRLLVLADLVIPASVGCIDLFLRASVS